MTAVSIEARDRLPAWSLYGAVLSAAGLPIYIYAPKYYADTYGVSLTALGAVLFGLRLFDVVQDPVLGWISERLTRFKKLAITLTAFALALAMIGLFAVAPPIAPIWWFGLTITGLFTARLRFSPSALPLSRWSPPISCGPNGKAAWHSNRRISGTSSPTRSRAGC